MSSPAELDSLRSMLRIAKIIVLIFMIIDILLGIAFVVALSFIALGLGFFGGFFLLGFIVNLVIYLMIGGIQTLVDQGQYAQAKEKTLVWMILGFIFGGLLPGIFLLLAYLKFDPVINWQRSQGMQGQPQQMWGQPAPTAQPGTWGQPQSSGWGQPTPAPGAQPAQSAAWNSPQPAAAAPAPVAPAAPAAATCPRCGKPATWVAQYSRWYCYTDAQYL